MVILSTEPLQNNNHSMRNNKTIAVVGHLVWDRIVKPDGGITEALGGIAYSLSALGATAGENTRIVPVCNVGEDLYDKARSHFERFPAIDFNHVRRIKRNNKIHELKYMPEGYRKECNIGEMPTISPTLFKAIGSIDILLLNYIGGDEFPPANIRKVKAMFNPLVYMDYHSLALGKEPISKKPVLKVKRHFRYNPRWRDYIRCADIVQMNNVELRSIFPGTETDTEGVAQAAIRVHDEGPRAVVITREDKAVVMVTGEVGNPAVHTFDVNPAKVIDPTGCGDCHAAGTITSYIKHGDLIKACKAGLKLASIKAGFSGLEGFFTEI